MLTAIHEGAGHASIGHHVGLQPGRVTVDRADALLPPGYAGFCWLQGARTPLQTWVAQPLCQIAGVRAEALFAGVALREAVAGSPRDFAGLPLRLASARVHFWPSSSEEDLRAAFDECVLSIYRRPGFSEAAQDFASVLEREKTIEGPRLRGILLELFGAPLSERELREAVDLAVEAQRSRACA